MKIPDPIKLLSIENINKHARQKGIQHPSVIYPALVGVLGGTVWGLFGMPVALGIAIGSVVISGSSALFNVIVRKPMLSVEYVEEIKKRLQSSKLEMLDELHRQFETVKFERGSNQLQRVRNKFEQFGKLLNETFENDELAYGRYFGLAEQVYFSVLDNLNRISSSLIAISAIDVGFINSRLENLKDRNDLTAEHNRELKSLNQRLQLHNDETFKIRGLMTDNEEAMTALDITASQLTDFNFGTKATLSVEEVMDELGSIANRLKH